MLFQDVIKIIMSENPKNVFDVGCNTGKFELALFAKGFKGNITLLDLPQQLEKAKENLQAAGYAGKCVFYPIDILKKGTEFPGTKFPETEFPGNAVATGEESGIAFEAAKN